MSILILSTEVLPQLSENARPVETPDLQVNDAQFDYSTYEGAGLWIPVFIEFLEQMIAQHCRIPGFRFPSNDSIDDSVIEEIPSAYGRSLAVRFINSQYHDWRTNDVTLPRYDGVASECRGFCEDCEHAYKDVFDEDGEVVDTEWVCQEDCDSFLDHVEECYRQEVDIDSSNLEVRLADFLKFDSEDLFPPLH